MTAATPPTLFAFLDSIGVAHHTLQHPAVFRVGEGLEIKAALPGGHTKNLFLKDARDRLWLVTALGETAIDLKSLHRVIGSARLSFGSPTLMGETLGVAPGSVTPFGLINDAAHRVSLVVDAALLATEPLNFHPLVNTATTAVSRAGFLTLLDRLGVTPLVVDFSTDPATIVG